MLHVRIIGAAVVVGIVATVLAVILVRGHLKDEVRLKAEDSVARADKLLDQIKELGFLKLVNLTEEAAAHKAFITSMSQPLETPEAMANRREDLFEEIERLNADMVQRGFGAKADLFAIVDAQGAIITRNVEPKTFEGVDLSAKHGMVKDVLQGQISKNVWLFDEAGSKKLMSVAGAPIYGDQRQILGAAIIGFEYNNAVAKREKKLVGSEIFYFYGNKISAASLEAKVQTEVADWMEDVRKELESNSQIIEKVMSASQSSDILDWPLMGENYLTILSAMPVTMTGQKAGYGVAISFDRAFSPFTSVITVLIVLGGLFTLLLSILLALFAKQYLKPFEEIERGIMEFNNGNMEYIFQVMVPGLAGNIAHLLNIMLAILLGRPMPDDDELDEGTVRPAWTEALQIEEIAPGEARQMGESFDTLPPQAQILAQEPAGDYQRRLFNEYIAAKKQLGEKVELITMDGFVLKLQRSSENLKAKYNCKQVRFEIQVKENQVVLIPVPLR